MKRERARRQDGGDAFPMTKVSHRDNPMHGLVNISNVKDMERFFRRMSVRQREKSEEGKKEGEKEEEGEGESGAARTPSTALNHPSPLSETKMDRHGRNDRWTAGKVTKKQREK